MPHLISPPTSPQAAATLTATSSEFPPLFVNDGPLDPADIFSLHPSYPTEDLTELRARYERDGYLFLKGLLPRSDVLRARSAYFTSLQPTGVLDPSTSPVDGIFDSSKDCLQYPGVGAGVIGNGRKGEGASSQFVELAVKAHTEDWYTEFCEHSALRDFIAKISGWGESTLGVKRSLLRNNVPGNQAIGVHYDQIFLRHGEPTSYTAWVPIGDVGVQGGGLIYLENGHRLGVEVEDAFTKKAIEAGLTEEQAKSAFNSNMDGSGLLDSGPARYGKRFNRRWLVADYEAGDVVLHTPFTIHASTLNVDPKNRIRLATDLRFVDTSKPWDTRWNNHYRLDDGV